MSNTGAFQGTMLATTPTGLRIARAVRFELFDGMTSPVNPS